MEKKSLIKKIYFIIIPYPNYIVVFDIFREHTLNYYFICFGVVVKGTNRSVATTTSFPVLLSLKLKLVTYNVYC